MADNGARSSNTTDGASSGKDNKKRAAVRVRHTYGGSRYQIIADEIIRTVKSNKRPNFSSDVGAMVRTKCAADWESWRTILEKLKMHMIDELATNWDIDKSDPNLMKVINNVFKSRFWEWKFVMNALQHNSKNHKSNGR
ncbi:hypothetical protein D8674_029037 [Pyrus ussuriensis x Pyrus communis]|uniref:Uncharacterized protein n=1 Tax=Pyrus ussuriensis x Pyrus communis TaxID=2448454 RepID=A0A5N5I583_9ROSA|nr:hypothetical protein D8674_029037 [Pyrus ussuriensis x Pyrus communis]